MTKKSVLITGCSEGGIGAALAFEFQQRGYSVFATARNTSKIPKSLTELPCVSTLQLDVTNNESISAAVHLFQKISQSTLENGQSPQGLDVLVHNSGAGMYGPLLDADVNEARALFDVNFFGVMQVTQAFSRLLVQAQGVLVNISSASGELNQPYSSIYNASKAAITTASETWRLELEPLGVRVVTVVAGTVATRFHGNTNEIKLAEDSYYLPVKEILDKKQRGKPGSQKMSAEEFATAVVSDILAGKSGKIWRGSESTKAWIAKSILPTWILDNFMRGSESGIPELWRARNLSQR
ncbi:hypothetical protein E8E14_000048 [Neopestalotiopsis sp. 37M]|nr:hypothetical protein E8E14_000048 [Neopestalotiopsis sp. 37M]